MNYRHAFHAGNHADVLKHVVLSRTLLRMGEKDKPMAFLDTHAGVGIYDLMGVAAGKTMEWQGGVGLMTDVFAPDVEALLVPYRQALARVNKPGEMFLYPGSPSVAAGLLRTNDRLVFNELHPIDATSLQENFEADDRVQVMTKDALEALRAQLPLRERRGVVLIDPAFEVVDETERCARLLSHGLKRMASCVFVLWYPVKGATFARDFVAAIKAMAPNLLQVEIAVREAFAGGGLAGSGLLIVNAPWKLDDDFNTLVPALAQRLGVGPWGRGQVNWLTPKP